MKRILTYLFILLLFITLAGTASLANDTALSGLGDSVGPFEGIPDVVMDKEVINLNIYPNKTDVNVVFYFKNIGKKQTILVGFPDEFETNKIKGQDGYGESNIVGPINDFKSWVNSKPVKAEKKTQATDVKMFSNNYKAAWLVWPVTFEQGKITVIKNTYWVQNGYNVLMQKNFTYTLITGSKWKNKIGTTEINANFMGGLTTNDVLKEESSKGMTILDKTKAKWILKNFEPSYDNDTGNLRVVFKRNMIPLIRTKNLIEPDLKGMTDWELKILRNEIYARHGRAFKSESLKAQYISTKWYKVNPKYSDNLLNSFEKRNAQFILNYEKKIGSKIIFND